MKTRTQIMAVVLTVLIAVLVSPAMAMSVYDFETTNITSGSLGTQDNWHIDDTGFGQLGTVGTGTGINSTRTLSGRSIVSRVNNGNFSYSIDTNSTSWGFSFDFTPSGATRYAYLGRDADANNILDSSEFFGWTGGGFHLHNGGANYYNSVALSLPSTDWIRVGWEFDWVNMKVWAYYKNLTAGGNYTAVGGLQGVTLSSANWVGLKNFSTSTLGFGLYQYPGGQVDNYAFGLAACLT